MEEGKVGSSRTVLVVDDSLSTRMIVSAMLQQMCPDWSIIKAADADDALSKVDAVEIDTMLLDINMPGKNGFELAEMLREQFPNAHIAMLTANIQEKVRVRAGDAGYQFIPKPVTEEKLRFFLEGQGGAPGA